MAKGVLIGLPVDEEEDDDMADSGEEKTAAAEELIAAIGSEDPAAVIDAFEAMYELCRKG